MYKLLLCIFFTKTFLFAFFFLLTTDFWFFKISIRCLTQGCNQHSASRRVEVVNKNLTDATEADKKHAHGCTHHFFARRHTCLPSSYVFLSFLGNSQMRNSLHFEVKSLFELRVPAFEMSIAFDPAEWQTSTRWLLVVGSFRSYYSRVAAPWRPNTWTQAACGRC